MKICPKCGAELEDDAKTCTMCEHWVGWEDNL